MVTVKLAKRKKVLNADLTFQLHHLKLLVLFVYLLVTLDDLVKEKRRIIDLVLENITNKNDLSGVSLMHILSECEISQEEYYDALDYISSRVTVLYKRKPSEQNVSPYNTVILSLMKSIMNVELLNTLHNTCANLNEP